MWLVFGAASAGCGPLAPVHPACTAECPYDKSAENVIHGGGIGGPVWWWVMRGGACEGCGACNYTPDSGGSPADCEGFADVREHRYACVPSCCPDTITHCILCAGDCADFSPGCDEGHCQWRFNDRADYEAGCVGTGETPCG